MPVVRRIQVYVPNPDTPNVYEVHCSDCSWLYCIKHISYISDKLEEHHAAREFMTHRCEDFPFAIGKAN
jgi:hypothetical protein